MFGDFTYLQSLNSTEKNSSWTFLLLKLTEVTSQQESAHSENTQL